MNPTIEKFGWPATVVKTYENWVVLLRPAQPTLGSLVLAARSDAEAFGDVSAEAHAELKQVTADIEAALRDFVGYDKINYLMLMMNDPHVHFHVIPRYSDDREWHGITFADAGWPGVPNLGTAIALDADQIESLRNELIEHF